MKENIYQRPESVQEQNKKYSVFYERLEKILGFSLDRLKYYSYLKLTAEPFMPLHVNVIDKQEKTIIIAMAHNFEMNGDIVPDPDMEIEIDLEKKTAEPLTFQNSLIYTKVWNYDENGEKTGLDIGKRQSLREFFDLWTNNLIIQGHKISKEKKV
jgi:hypothetical protein